MIALAVDTATEIFSVALLDTDPAAPRRLMNVRDIGLVHNAIAMPAVDSLLHDAGITLADVELVACARGPGSFTGLRIGMATAKGLAASIAARRGLTDLPLVSVPTLHAIAAPHSPLGLVLPLIDARKKRFYGALFRGAEVVVEPFDLGAEEIASTIRDVQNGRSAGDWARIIVTGPGATVLGERISLPDVLLDSDCRRGWADWIAEIAIRQLATDGFDAPDRGPDYFRGSDAEIGARPPVASNSTTGARGTAS